MPNVSEMTEGVVDMACHEFLLAHGTTMNVRSVYQDDSIRIGRNDGFSSFQKSVS